MKAITVVQGTLLAVILATWMWTWWWNRYVTTHRPDPDYDAATAALTRAIIKVGVHGTWIGSHRAGIAREIVDAALPSGDETTGEIEVTT